MHAKFFFFFFWVRKTSGFYVAKQITIHLYLYSKKDDLVQRVFKRMNDKLMLVVVGENYKNITSDDFMANREI